MILEPPWESNSQHSRPPKGQCEMPLNYRAPMYTLINSLIRPNLKKTDFKNI